MKIGITKIIITYFLIIIINFVLGDYMYVQNVISVKTLSRNGISTIIQVMFLLWIDLHLKKVFFWDVACAVR
jgi:hypothetical protein